MRRKFFAAALAVLLMTAAFPVTAHAASDVSSSIGDWSDITDDWYTDAVQRYGYADIFDDGSGKFNPIGKITRIEFVRLLHTALGITINYFSEPDIGDDFTDIDNSHAGAGALIDLVTAGIVQRGGSFDPDAQLNREVMIHWIIEALNYMTGGDFAIPKIKPPAFKDSGLIAVAYKSDVDTATVLGLIKGRGDNLLFPKDGTTRAEAAVVVMRLMDVLSGWSGSGRSVAVTASAWETSDGLVMSLTIQNDSDKAVAITHSSGQKFDFKLLDENGESVYTWSADKQFIMVAGTTEINPGESVVFTASLDKEPWDAVKSSVVSIQAYIAGTSENFVIDENGYAGQISYA